MSANLIETKRATPAPARFEESIASPFILRTVSEATRATYRRVIKEFFGYVRQLHPAEVTPTHVMRYRDHLIGQKRKAATVALKLSVLRSFFEYLRAGGAIQLNPASTRLVKPPAVSDESPGRALSAKEVRYLLAGPDRSKPEGARDYAMLLLMVRLALRVGTVCKLRVTSIKWSHGRWTLRAEVKGGKEHVWPLPEEVKEAIDAYRKLDRKRRQIQHSDGPDAFLFQPHVNYRTLVFDKALSTRAAWHMVKRWAEYARIGDVSPHDLRHTAITRAYEKGGSTRQVQMMSKHKDLRNLQRYDHGRENLDLSAVNLVDYDEDAA